MGVCKTGKAGNLHPRAEWEQLEDGCNSQTVFWLHRELHCTAKSTTGLQEQAAPDKHRVPEGCTHEYACCLILDLPKMLFQNLTVCQKVFLQKALESRYKQHYVLCVTIALPTFQTFICPR